MEENKQLQLFENQLAEVPKTRALVLRKAAREKGIEFAEVKNKSIIENKALAEAAKESIERIGSSAKFNHFMAGCHKQLNAAVGIKNTKDPNISIAHLAGKILGVHGFVKVFRQSQTGKQRSEGRAAVAEGLSKFMELVS